MGIFNNIMDKLGFGDKEPDDEPAKKAASERSAPNASSASPIQYGRGTKDPVAVQPSPAKPTVDVVGMLEQKAAANPQELNWKTSIVDLLKLLDLDSSYESRKELAVELKCPADKMDDSAEMNTWLHKAVMQKLAENGGNVPPELLD